MKTTNEIKREVFVDAIALRLGACETDPHATFLAERSLTQLARVCAQQDGQIVPTDEVTLLQRSFSSAGTLFSSAFTDAIDKTILNFYEDARPTWRNWCNFTTTKRLSGERMELDPVGNPPKVGPGGEFKKSQAQAKTRSLALGKAGHLFDVSIEAILSDDANLISRLLKEHVASFIRLEDEQCIEILETPGTLDSVAFFSTTHGNLLTGAALASNKLADAVKTLRNMTGRNDVKLHLRPAAIIVPTALENTARGLVVALFNQDNDPDRLAVVVVPGLSSTTTWYLTADKSQIDSLIMQFLEGQPTPQIDRVKAFEIDGARYRIKHSCSCKAVQPSGIIKNTE